MIRTSGFTWASVRHSDHRINQPAHVDAPDVSKACRVFAISPTNVFHKRTGHTSQRATSTAISNFTISNPYFTPINPGGLFKGKPTIISYPGYSKGPSFKY